MGRMKIKKPGSRRKIRMSYNTELEELREWQDNMYNPGHFMGTGRMPYPMKRIAQNPKLRLAYLLFMLLPGAVFLFFDDLEWYEVLPGILVMIVLALIIWDSKRALKK